MQIDPFEPDVGIFVFAETANISNTLGLCGITQLAEEFRVAIDDRHTACNHAGENFRLGAGNIAQRGKVAEVTLCNRRYDRSMRTYHVN